MNETMLALLGFATIIMIIVLLLRNVTVPALAFIGVSSVSALILVLTGTFTVSEVGKFISKGVSGVHSTAALFIFSVLFFGIMTDAGMFDRIIDALMKKSGEQCSRCGIYDQHYRHNRPFGRRRSFYVLNYHSSHAADL